MWKGIWKQFLESHALTPIASQKDDSEGNGLALDTSGKTFLFCVDRLMALATSTVMSLFSDMDMIVIAQCSFEVLPGL